MLHPTDDYLPPRRPATAKQLFRLLTAMLIVPSLLTVALAGAFYLLLATRFDIGKAGRMPERSRVEDRHGELVGLLDGANRIVVPLGQVSPLFLDALIAREDSRFFHHQGIDLRGVARAAVRNLRDRGMTQGASTLTMQLARVSYDIPEKTFHRKLLEAALAWRLEREYSKRQILEFYVNRVYFGSGIYGVQRAAEAYFGKTARELTLGEGALLAGIIRAPNRFCPFRHAREALLERDSVVGRMRLLGFISDEEARAALAEQPAFRPQGEAAERLNSYAMDAVRRDLDVILENQDREDGGLVIRTTLDLGLQRAAEAALENRLREIESAPGFPHTTRPRFQEAMRQDPALGTTGRPDYLQGAILALENRSGGILAVVGGRNFSESQYNRALMSQRQIGSLFKPFVYAAAYRRGLLPGTLVSDDPILPDEIAWSGQAWSPENSDNRHLGLLPVQTGLVKSRNTVSVRVGEKAGIADVMQMAAQAGLKPPRQASPQLYIGNLGADLKMVTSAFSAFARDGYKTRPYIIESITDEHGNLVYRNAQIGFQLLPPAVAWLTHKGLEQVMQPPEGTAGRARSALGFEGPAAGKTGTTNDYKDAWFVGYTAPVTCGVWIGLDDPRTIMPKGYGGALALPVWVDVMKSAAGRGFAPEEFRTSVTVTQVEVCSSSGGLATWACRQEGCAYPATLPYELVPREECHDDHGRYQLALPAIRPRPILPGYPEATGAEGPGILDRIRRFFW